MNRDRFKDADWFPKGDETVVIGGQGGIGSWLTLLLSRIGYNLVTYDFDTVEEHNIGGQYFKSSDIGKYKTIAIRDNVMEYANNSITVFNEPISENTIFSPFMMSAFDNMKARRDLFEIWKQSFEISNHYPIFIDGRLEPEMFQIFCVRPHQAELYEKECLFDDSAVEELSCTFKQTSHTAAMIAGHMTAFFTNHISNIHNKGDIREIPFLYEYATPFNLTHELS